MAWFTQHRALPCHAFVYIVFSHNFHGLKASGFLYTPFCFTEHNTLGQAKWLFKLFKGLEPLKSSQSFTSELIKNVPIKKISLKEQKPFINLVDKIISLKQQGKDSSEHEKKIDELVYKLYDITPAEQKIIETA